MSRSRWQDQGKKQFEQELQFEQDQEKEQGQEQKQELNQEREFVKQEEQQKDLKEEGKKPAFSSISLALATFIIVVRILYFNIHKKGGNQDSRPYC